VAGPRGGRPGSRLCGTSTPWRSARRSGRFGFTCLQLYRSRSWGLCLHVWTSAEPSPTLVTSLIHSHSWDLSSQVLCGRLENIEIRVEDGPPSPTHRVVEITSVQGTDVLHPTQRLVCCIAAESVRIGAGENYALPAGTFHLSKPSAAGLTATVLLAEYRHRSPELALGRLDARDRRIVRQAWPPEDVRRMAVAALRDLTVVRPTDRPVRNDGSQ
jgi:hypothetical protein